MSDDHVVSLQHHPKSLAHEKLDMQRPNAPPARADTMLMAVSLLSILLSVIHLADDIARGFERGDVRSLSAIPIFAIWLYGTLVLAGRRSGYVIMLLGALLGLVVPVVHMTGRGVGGAIAHSDGGLFFASTLIALGVSAVFSAMLAVNRLWSTRRPRAAAAA